MAAPAKGKVVPGRPVAFGARLPCRGTVGRRFMGVFDGFGIAGRDRLAGRGALPLRPGGIDPGHPDTGSLLRILSSQEISSGYT
jgi:hypothetical protein